MGWLRWLCGVSSAWAGARAAPSAGRASTAGGTGGLGVPPNVTGGLGVPPNVTGGLGVPPDVTGVELAYSWSLYWILRGLMPRMVAALEVEPLQASSVRRMAKRSRS